MKQTVEPTSAATRPEKTTPVGTLAETARRLNCRRTVFTPALRPPFRRYCVHFRRRKPPAAVLVIDWRRLADPAAALNAGVFALPRGAVVLIRSAGAKKPLADYIALARAARAQGYGVLAATTLRALPRYLIDGGHVGEAARRAPALSGWGLRRGRGLPLTFAVHDAAGLAAAAGFGAAAVFLSPAFATASHPGQAPLPPWRFRDLCRRSGSPVLALGGVNAFTVVRLLGADIAGVAALDGWRRGKPLPPREGRGEINSRFDRAQNGKN